MSNLLREHLEAWEHQAAAEWERVIRSPEVLLRVGTQLSRTLQSQQRMADLLRDSFAPHTPPVDPARLLYLLERLEHQLDALTRRIERLERTQPHD